MSWVFDRSIFTYNLSVGFLGSFYSSGIIFSLRVDNYFNILRYRRIYCICWNDGNYFRCFLKSRWCLVGLDGIFIVYKVFRVIIFSFDIGTGLKGIPFNTFMNTPPCLNRSKRPSFTRLSSRLWYRNRNKKIVFIRLSSWLLARIRFFSKNHFCLTTRVKCLL